MTKTVLAFLEAQAAQNGGRVLFEEENASVTFASAREGAMRVGQALCPQLQVGEPIVIFSEKSAVTPILYFGVLYAGCHYVPLDVEMPFARLKQMLDLVRPKLVLADKPYPALLEALAYSGSVLLYEDTWSQTPNEALLAKRQAAVLDTDPMCVIFTSGSSGTPKGILLPHRAVLDYITVFAETFGLNETNIYGNQAPLDYVAALRDIYLPLYTGAKTVLIPKGLFSMPQRLFEYVNVKGVNTLCWVASALSLCSEMGVFSVAGLPKVEKVFFTGSVMPSPQLRTWQQNLPGALFVNHYGPTEITASCTYAVLDHVVEPDEALSIGRPFDNTEILLITGDGRHAAPGERGEICVRGSCLALGYYNNPEKTAEAFVQNPLQPLYPEIIYKTGDIGSFNPDGTLNFHGRRDFQVKHMGHRIELSEIEAEAAAVAGVQSCACLYRQEKQQLWLFYTGPATSKDIALHLRANLPAFMVPRKFSQLQAMPLSPNGKYDLNALKALMGAV